jgi:putative transposase
MEQRHRRKSLRLSDYDYAVPGAYFVTICTAKRKNLLGLIEDELMKINDAGQIIQRMWESIPIQYPDTKLDAFVVMPNHIHGIIIVGAQFIAPSFTAISGKEPDAGVMNHAPTLGSIIRSLKAKSTRMIRQDFFPQFAWQRNYYEHVIRNDTALNKIREYISTNPMRCELDRENPQARGKDDFDDWLATFKTKPLKKNPTLRSEPIAPTRPLC